MNMAKNREPGVPVTLDWIKSNCTENATTGCWEWNRSLKPNGYGNVWFREGYTGPHRVAYALSEGAIPPGLNVLHRCDVRSCCNPEHLFVGTQLHNMQDMAQKGRAPVGERHGGAKLTPEQVHLIRTSPGTHAEKAMEFGVTRPTITKIMTGKRWALAT